MFDIFHRRSKITVDAFTFVPAIHEYFKIERATKHVPDWFKKMPTKLDRHKDGFRVPMPTMKGCVAITDMFKSSYVLSNWEETILRTVDGKFEYTTPQEFEHIKNIHSFQDDQKSSQFRDVAHVKIDSPWLLKEKTGVMFMLGDTFWNNYDHHSRFHYKVVPGMIQYKTQSALNVNIVAKPNTPDFMIAAGEPLAQLYPMTDNVVEIVHHLVSHEEWWKIHASYAYRHSFSGRHNVNERLRKWNNKS